MESVFTQKEPNTIQRLFARIAHRYDLANSLLSLGCDSLWRANVGARVRRWAPATILDLATGSGVLAHELKKQIPGARVVGADFCAPMLTFARRRGIAELVVADGLALPFQDGRFDVVTMAFGLRNMASYDLALREAGRVLRAGGHLVILDFSLPNPPLRALYEVYLNHVLPVLAGWVTGEPDAYYYFAGTIKSFPKGDAMLELLRGCGFANCDARPLTLGIVTVYTGENRSQEIPDRPRPRSADGQEIDDEGRGRLGGRRWNLLIVLVVVVVLVLLMAKKSTTKDEND